MTFTPAGEGLSFAFDGEVYECSTIYRDTTLVVEEYDMAFFYSPYYQAQDDYATVYFGTSSDKFQIGVLLPVSLLMEDDVDNVSDLSPFYLRQLNLAVRKLIDYSFGKGRLEQLSFNLYDLYSYDSFMVFLYIKDKVGTDFPSLLPSLYDAGYYQMLSPHEDPNSKVWYKSSLMCQISGERKHESRRNVYVNAPSGFQLFSEFLKYAYTVVLPHNENVYYRFMVLYQIIELLSDHSYIADFDKANLLFQEGKISKNDLREKLIEAVTEKKQIQRIYEGVSYKDDNILMDYLRQLFMKADIECPQAEEIGQYIYTLRNKIVHELSRMHQYYVEIGLIVEYMEKNIYNLLISHRVKLNMTC